MLHWTKQNSLLGDGLVRLVKVARAARGVSVADCLELMK